MDRGDELYAIEAIKNVKARYWRAVDTKDAALLRSVFCNPCLIDFRGSVGGEPTDAQMWHDPDRFCADMIASTVGIVSVHHGFPPEITVRSDDEASAIWPMEDLLWNENPSAMIPFRRFHGRGHYHDVYRRTPQGWMIATTKITRIRIEGE
jgi:hypothetical protein